IIASSPTCEFGRVLHHLAHSLERPTDVVLFVGWTPPGTLGRRLQEGQKRVRIFDRFYDVQCEIRILHGMSAHADADEMLKFLKPAMSEHTQAFVVHGEPDQSEVFAQRLVSELGADDATVPAIETSVVL
ncbi:MAG TPA: MBL fold metallo-hydrolase RNA specificity domain-containing protein, partial [Tepidisphaeraceae bacterium]|nr:MBL fold metallo-hydrolase RNA specificity domain-containing protein [Tepidisphaeraceae bacterium]